MNKLREDFLNNSLTTGELEDLLKDQDKYLLLNLHGDEWRDWVDGIDWESMGSSNLVNLVFEKIDLEIEELHYFGISNIINIVSSSAFSLENQLNISNLLIESSAILDAYGDFFQESCDEILAQEWLSLHECLIKNLQDRGKAQELLMAKNKLEQFFQNELL